jgi:hypothetical protein
LTNAFVGEQNDEWDLWTLRLMFRGQMKFPPLGRLKHGKLKEPFVYEMVGDAAVEGGIRLRPHQPGSGRARPHRARLLRAIPVGVLNHLR